MSSRLILTERLPTKGIDLSDKQRKRLEDRGEFPRRVRMTAKTHAYVEAEIDDYVEQKIAERDAGQRDPCERRTPHVAETVTTT